jgi:hypothetical protein
MIINELKTTVDRLEGKFAVLAYGSEELLWPKDKLPEHTHEGDAMVLVAKKDEDATKDRTELAKTMLNELLKRDED